jgi:uncharacterized membrane protein
MWRDRLKFELRGCGVILLAFVIALGIGLVVMLAHGSADLAAAIAVVALFVMWWALERLGK